MQSHMLGPRVRLTEEGEDGSLNPIGPKSIADGSQISSETPLGWLAYEDRRSLPFFSTATYTKTQTLYHRRSPPPAGKKPFFSPGTPPGAQGKMAVAATSAAALQSIGTTFLSGAKGNRGLLSSPAASGRSVTATGSSRRLVVAAAAAQKKSWVPGVRGGGNFIDPEWLDGSLPGDYGFDPLGLGKDPAFLKWYREAELIHGRWAMAAVVGIFVGQAWSGVPWFEAGAQPGAVAPFSFGTLLGTQLLLMGWVESKRWVDFFNPDSQSVSWATPWSRTAENFANATGEQGYPGGKFFDPLSLAGTIRDGVYVPDPEKLERLKLAEIKHARIAMLAMLIFYFEAGQGKTPLGALGL